MDQHQDELIGHELGRALRIDPSPGFVVGIRERIGTEHIAPAWGWSRTMAVAAALLIAVVATALFVRIERQQPTEILSQSPSASPPNAAAVVSPPDAVAGRNRATAVSLSNAAQKRDAAPIARSGELLIPRKETAAFQGLLAVAQQGDFRYQLVGDATSVVADISTGEIVVPPITLLPLVSDDSLD